MGTFEYETVLQWGSGQPLDAIDGLVDAVRRYAVCSYRTVGTLILNIHLDLRDLLLTQRQLDDHSRSGPGASRCALALLYRNHEG